MRYFVFIFVTILFSSCLKEEIPIPKFVKTGDLTDMEVDIGGNYLYQIYFDFSSGQIVKKQSRDIWELGFESGESGKHILINGAKNMFIYPTEIENIDEITSKSGYLKNPHFDSPFGEYDSLAMRGFEDGKVRIVDMGSSATNLHQGWYKIKILAVDETSYTFAYAPLEATTSQTVTIEKDDNYNFVYYSLLSNSVLEVEPPKNDWDIVFTQFTQRLYQPLVMPYLVTGILLNRNGVEAKRINNSNFEEIDLEFAKSLTLTDTLNVIGFDWKEYDFDTEEYTIYPAISYVLKNQDKRYYKIRFIDFYSPTGETGNFRFEYLELGK